VRQLLLLRSQGGHGEQARSHAMAGASAEVCAAATVA
jgi:hypothetical protein